MHHKAEAVQHLLILAARPQQVLDRTPVASAQVRSKRSSLLVSDLWHARIQGYHPIKSCGTYGAGVVWLGPCTLWSEILPLQLLQSSTHSALYACNTTSNHAHRDFTQCAGKEAGSAVPGQYVVMFHDDKVDTLNQGINRYVSTATTELFW